MLQTGCIFFFPLLSLFVSKVVGVKDERLGEQVCACIRLKEGQSCSAEEIRAFCKGQVRGYKQNYNYFFLEQNLKCNTVELQLI